MELRRVRPAVLEMRLHVVELSALIAAARWVVQGAHGELPEEARGQLRQLLATYDREVARLDG